jgi:iron complex transport system ATP-binding protein
MEIAVKDLSFSYGAHRVLDGVSFTAQSGELLAVLGPNGVGKSTLFYCLLGLSRPGGGEILLGGKPVGAAPPSELARQIAYVPQSHAPTFNYSVFDMVLMGTTARVGGLSAPGADELALADEALERVGIAHLRERGYLRISGGERQLTLIARALAQQAKILIMDEPTANLDYGNQLRVLSRVKALTREGYTVVQSTHNPDHAFLFADRVLALKDGRVAALGTPREAVTEELIESLYGVRVRLRENEDGRIFCEPMLDG